MENLHRPLLTAGLFLAAAKLYTTSQDIDVPFQNQVVVASVLGASALAVENGPVDNNTAVRSLTTGSVFAGAMYVGFENDNFITHAVLGTLSAYASEILLPRPAKSSNEDTNEFEFS